MPAPTEPYDLPIKAHPRQPEGGRSTDGRDCPPEGAGYAARSPEQLLLAQAQANVYFAVHSSYPNTGLG